MAAHDPKQIWFNREINQRLEEVLRGIAASHLNIVENGMRFQNLKQDKRILRLANGIIIESSICFGKQTSRVYVPPPVPVKPIVIEEEENELVFVITREYDDEPLTRENMSSSGGFYVYEAIQSENGWVINKAIFFCRGTSEVFGKWEYNEQEDVWYYTPNAYSTWACSYSYPKNEWTVNISDDATVKSDTGMYIVSARFKEKSLVTVYPRVYKYSEQGALYPSMTDRDNKCEAVGPGRYFMTTPYYEKTSKTGSLSFTNIKDCASHTVANPYTWTVKSTVPVLTAVGMREIVDSSQIGGATYFGETYTNPRGDWTEEYQGGDMSQLAWSCVLHQNDMIFNYGTYDKYIDLMYEVNSVMDSADIEMSDGTNTLSYTYRYNRINDTHHGTAQEGDSFTTYSGWKNPPEPVERDGQPPYRDIIEVNSYISAVANKNSFDFVTRAPTRPVHYGGGWYFWVFTPTAVAPLGCDNTAESNSFSIGVGPRYYAIYDEADYYPLW